MRITACSVVQIQLLSMDVVSDLKDSTLSLQVVKDFSVHLDL